MANQNTYLMINITGLIPKGAVQEISLLDYYGNVIHSAEATPHRTNHHMYFIGPFIPPKGLFFIKVKGVDEDVSFFLRLSNVFIETNSDVFQISQYQVFYHFPLVAFHHLLYCFTISKEKPPNT